MIKIILSGLKAAIAIILLPCFCLAQGIVNNGAAIVLNNGTTTFANIYIDGTGGNYLNQTSAGVNGTIVNYNPGATITLKGSWTNNATVASNITNAGATTNGVIINDSCTVVFAGTSAGTTQTISGATYGTSFYSITFSGSSPKAFSTVASSVKSQVTVSANTTVNAGSVAGQGLTLLSSATKTAAVTALPSTGVISGIANVQRYITGNNNTTYRGYRLLSSPVNVSGNSNGGGNLDLSYINTTIQGNAGAYTGGPGGTANGFTFNNPNPTIYLYNEALTTSNTTFVSGKTVGVIAITPPTVTTLAATVSTPNVSVPVGNGYLMYFIGDNTRANPSSSILPNNTTITATGTLNQGAIPVTIWSTGSTSLSFHSGTGAAVNGINQVGNPYASTINLEQVYVDNYNSSSNPIGNIFYELNEPGQNYITYQIGGAVSKTRAGKYITAGQGFMVAATATGQTLTFQEDQKVATQVTGSTTPALLLALKLPDGFADLHLQLTSDADTLVDTQTGIYLSSGWSDAFTSSDAIDLDGMSPIVSLSSFTSDGYRVGINELGSYLKNKRIKLFVKAAATGQYNIGLADIKNIDPLYHVYLVDKLLKDSVDLRTTKAYDFAINTGDTTTFGANRFVLAIEITGLQPYQLLSFTGQKTDPAIRLQWTTANEGNFTGFTLQRLSGTQWVGIDSLQSNGSGEYTYLDTAPLSGVNTYRLMQNDITGNITYSNLVTVSTNSNGILNVYPNPAQSIVNVNVNLPASTYKLNIYNSFGGVMNQSTVNGTNWSQDITGYNTGTYIIEVADSKGNLVGKTKFIKVQ